MARDEHEAFPRASLGGVSVERQLVGRFAHAAAVDRREVSAFDSLKGINVLLYLHQPEFFPGVNYHLIGMDGIRIRRVSHSTTVDRGQVIACLGLYGASPITKELDGELFPGANLCGVSMNRQLVGGFAHAAAVNGGHIVSIDGSNANSTAREGNFPLRWIAENGGQHACILGVRRQRCQCFRQPARFSQGRMKCFSPGQMRI